MLTGPSVATAAITPAFAQDAPVPPLLLSGTPLLTEASDETQLTTLKGNTHRLARPQFKS
jgi:hypothetical protein